MKELNFNKLSGYFRKEWLIRFLSNLEERFSKQERTISIVIQGNLNKRSINTIPEYLKYGEVIVSCWENNNLELLEPYKEDIKIVVNNYKDVEKYYKQVGTQAAWVYQHHTTLNGLLLAENYFSIKVRSDESYPNLNPLIDKLISINHEIKNPKTKKYDHHKIITSNIYFRYDGENKFHPSDHIVAGRTQRMVDSFKKAKMLCKNKPIDRFPEQLLCRAIIESRFLGPKKGLTKLDESKSVEIMQENFDIIKISELPQHIWTSSYRKYRKLYNEEDWCHDINSISAR